MIVVQDTNTDPSGVKITHYESMAEVSDGYHTFNELYRYRMLYNAGFFNMLARDDRIDKLAGLETFYNVHKSKRHADGMECFGGGWFIIIATLPTGQISNHYELKDWDLFVCETRTKADEWDGHTPEQAADRIQEFNKIAFKLI
jgi:hypothetical protein